MKSPAVMRISRITSSDNESQDDFFGKLTQKLVRREACESREDLGVRGRVSIYRRFGAKAVMIAPAVGSCS